MLKLAALVIALVLLPAAAAQADARSASRGFARATLAYSDNLIALRKDRVDHAAPLRASLHDCIEDWRAHPYRRTVELFAFYEIVVGAPLWAAQGPIMAEYVAGLRRVEGVGRIGPLRDARRALESELAMLQTYFAQPIDACAEVRAWRAAGWGSPRPPQLARLAPVTRKWRQTYRRREVALIRAARLLARRGGATGRKAEGIVWLGLPVPDGVDRCDAVLDAIDPEETFCG